jgi:hypothetical protein
VWLLEERGQALPAREHYGGCEGWRGQRIVARESYDARESG